MPHVYLAAMLTLLCAWAWGAETTDTAVVLDNDHAEIKMDVERGNGVLVGLRQLPDGENLVNRGSMALWFRENNHWVDESWMKPASVSVDRHEEGVTVVLQQANFGGFTLEKSLTMSTDSPVVQYVYRLTALEEVRPGVMVPLSLALPVELDLLHSPGGTVAAQELPQKDFALQLDQPWYGFTSAASGRGVAVVPIRWPNINPVNWINHKNDGSLTLAMRLQPTASFRPGETIVFSYNLVPFSGDVAAAVALGREAKEGQVPGGEAPVAEGAQAPGELARGLRVVYSPPLAAAVRLDGVIDEPAWETAGLLDRFMNPDGKSFARGETRMRVAHDAEALYVAAWCSEPLMEQVRTDAQPGSATVWTDDCIELFIDPGGEGREFAHFIINAAGVRQHNLPGERATEYRWEAATARQEDAWTVEVRIPFADLDVSAPVEGEMWRFNACRSRVPVREAVTWSPTYGFFHVPHRFGVLVFGDPPVQLTHLDHGLENEGEHREMVMHLRNTTQQTQTVTAAVNVDADGMEAARLNLQAQLAGGDEQILRAPFSAAEVGAYRVAAEVLAGENRLFDGAFSAAVYSSNLNSSIYPAEDDENTLYLARGTVQQFFFVAANHSDETFERFSIVLELPEHIDVMQSVGTLLQHYYRPVLKNRELIEENGQRFVRWEWEVEGQPRRQPLVDVRFYNTWCGALVPGDDLVPGTYPFRFYIKTDTLSEQPRLGRLIVMPEPQGTQLANLTMGMSSWTMNPTPEFWEKIAATYRQIGINLVEGSVARRGTEWAEVLKQAGMRSISGLWWYWWNDDFLAANPDSAAIVFDGSADKRRICPEIIADHDSPAIMGLMDGIIANVRDGLIDGTWWDLEGPAAFDACFCPRCIETFRAYADIADDEELTPLRIQARHGDRWVDFACDQSVRIARRMQAAAKEAGIDWELSVYSGIHNEHTRRSYRVDWPTLIPEIDVATPSFYSFSAAGLGDSFTGGVREFMRMTRENSDIPVWTTLTVSYDRGSNFVADGRLTRQQIVKSVAFGAQGTLMWWWGPLDGRHYHGYAEATSLLAPIEEFFTDGVLLDEFLQSAMPPGTSVAAWRQGDRVLVMLFNDVVSGTMTVHAAAPEGWTLATTDERGTVNGTGREVAVEIPALDSRILIFTTVQ